MHCCGFEWIAIIERKYRLVLGPVIFVYAPNVFPQRHAPNEQQEHRDTDQSVNQVKQELLPESRIHLFQFGGSQQRQVLVHEDEEGDGKRHIQSRHPASDFKLLFILALLVSASCVAAVVVARIGGYLVQRRIGGKFQRAESERHRVAQRHHPAYYWPAHPLMLLGRPLQRFTVRKNLARRLAYGNAPGMRRTHHDALQHRLPADEGFLAALQSREQLDRRQKTQVLPPTSHRHWMLLLGRTTPSPTLRLPQNSRNYPHHSVRSQTSIPLYISRLPRNVSRASCASDCRNRGDRPP